MPDRKTVLVLTSSHLCRNPRAVKEAAALGAAGYEVTVMSVSARADFAAMDLELARGLPFRRKVIDYTRSTNSARRAHFNQRARTWAARQLCTRFGIESAETLGPASALLRFARSHPADLTIAHTEIPLWAAQSLVADGRRVAVDLEDWYSEDLLESDRRSRPIALLRKAESFALKNAAYVSVPSASMATALRETYGGPPPVVLRNTFPLPSRTPVANAEETTPPSFVWFSQTVGPGRGLEEFFAAWALTKTPSRVCLIGGARPGYCETLLSGLTPECRDQVTILPLLSPSALTTQLADFDIGLALEPRSPRNKDLTISNKIFQYLGAGLAVVATNTAGQTEVMRAAPESGVLVPTTDTAPFAAQLDELLGNRARLRQRQIAARAAAEREFCWERESPCLLAAVARALETPPAAF
jgi:glycosyltransferase involved in cell wall biosynthesis